MIVIRNAAILESGYSLIRRTANYVKGENTRERTEALNAISNDMPEAGGGGASASASAAPEVAASDDDDGGDGDGEDDCRRPRSKKSPPSFPPALLAFEPLSHYVGFGRSRIYQLIGAGEFPQPLKIGKSSRWVKAEIDAWIANQSAQRIGG